MARYLVTGATGFLGSHLTRHLVEQGHEVTALCRRVDPAPVELGASVVLGDVLDTDSVRRAAEGCEGVFHCAGKVSRKAEDAELLYRTNVDGTKVALAASRAAGVKRFVLASTSGTIAVSKEPEVLDEKAETPRDLIGRWPYYRTKLYAETFALEQSGADFEVVSVNPSLLLGPGDLHGSSTGDVELFLDGKVPVVPAGGISFVDARDVAPAMLAAMTHGKPGARYLMAGANMTLDAFFGRLSRASPSAASRASRPREEPPPRARGSESVRPREEVPAARRRHGPDLGRDGAGVLVRRQHPRPRGARVRPARSGRHPRRHGRRSPRPRRGVAEEGHAEPCATRFDSRARYRAPTPRSQRKLRRAERAP